MKQEYELLKKVSEVQGISGDEREVAILIKDELKDIATFEYDNLGSTIAYLNKDSDLPKVLLTAHMDEVGFIVSSITPEGFIKMSPIGGWWNHVLLAEVMVLKTRDGRKYFGVIGAQPPHGMPAEAIKGLKDSIDCNIYFFDGKVPMGVMYAVLALSGIALIGGYVLMNYTIGKRVKRR